MIEEIDFLYIFFLQLLCVYIQVLQLKKTNNKKDRNQNVEESITSN